MNQQNNTVNEYNIPEAKLVPAKHHYSIVWVIPLLAILIGAWLAYKTISEQGPLISIYFNSAEGLKAGETKVKFKEVELGIVEEITLSADLSSVEVTVRLEKQAKKFISGNTRFWVVRARVGTDQISGLSTLFSGAYISLDPGEPGAFTSYFKGLDSPPLVKTNAPGSSFNLKANNRGSIDIGSPVYYRKMKVGQVLGVQLDKKGIAVNMKLFIHAPYNEFIFENTRFWNNSGIDVTMDTEGIKVNTESLVSILIGGISFETPTNLEPGKPADEHQVFNLFENHEQIYESAYTRKFTWLLYFDGSVRGLKIGAPVEFRGIRIGKVLDVSLEMDLDQQMVRIPVLIEIEPDRIQTNIKLIKKDDQGIIFNKLVEKGLRAQLRTGSFMTGQLLINLDFYPHAPSAVIDWKGKYPIFPTVAAPIDEITNSIAHFLKKLKRVQVDKIGTDLRDTIQKMNSLLNSEELQQAIVNLNETLKNTNAFSQTLTSKVADDLTQASATLNKTLNQVQRFATDLNVEITPQISATLDQTQTTLKSIGNVVNQNSPVYHQLKIMLKALAEAAHSVKTMTDYLEQHPDALIYGKGEAK